MINDNNLPDQDLNIPHSDLLTPHFFNRDLSWIDFNGRVLEEGLRQDLPPLDRFWYLSIFSSNFDGFFMVRVAAMKQAMRTGAGPDPSGMKPEDQLSKTAEKTRSMIYRQYNCLLNELFPLLARGGLELVRPDTYSITQMDYLESYFLGQVYPILTPLRIEEDEKLPFISGIDLNVAFLMEPEQADGDTEDHIAIIQLPHALDRIIWLPKDTSTDTPRGVSPEALTKTAPDFSPEIPVSARGTPLQVAGRTCWALLDDLVLTWGAYLFPGYRVKETMLFRINRDADVSVDEKRDEDFIEAMEEVIEGRTHSSVVRMTFSSGSRYLRDELARRLGLEEQDLYEIDGPLDLGSLMDLASARDFDSLRSKAWKIYPSAAFNEEESLWDRISQRDVMLHLPYESFDSVVRFFQDAATDPQVISIKTALYRTSGNSAGSSAAISPVIKALEQAALNGKHVTAVVELKARFDEERNISWANRLEKAGVIVVYGLARLKVHAKISMIIRREKEGIKRYVHLSTGNYNDKTARQYDDLGLFTSREEIALDASIFFNMITGYSVISSMRKLVIAPTSLKRRVLELIDREAKRSNQEYPGKIVAKLNALADTDVVEALYRASQAGVKITLVVRGICTLIPGVPGLSENIRVLSIIGHYLEHSRIYYFSNGGAEEYYLASADWMPRNLERRVELMFPVLQEDIKARIKRILDSYCQDNQQARELKSDASWRHLAPAPGEDPVSAQEHFLATAAKAGGNFWTPRNEFVVRRSAPGGQ